MSAIGSLVFCTDCGNLLESSTGKDALLLCNCCGAENKGLLLKTFFICRFWPFRRHCLQDHFNLNESCLLPIPPTSKAIRYPDGGKKWYAKWGYDPGDLCEVWKRGSQVHSRSTEKRRRRQHNFLHLRLRIQVSRCWKGYFQFFANLRRWNTNNWDVKTNMASRIRCISKIMLRRAQAFGGI